MSSDVVNQMVYKTPGTHKITPVPRLSLAPEESTLEMLYSDLQCLIFEACEEIYRNIISSRHATSVVKHKVTRVRLTLSPHVEHKNVGK